MYSDFCLCFHSAFKYICRVAPQCCKCHFCNPYEKLRETVLPPSVKGGKFDEPVSKVNKQFLKCYYFSYFSSNNLDLNNKTWLCYMHSEGCRQIGEQRFTLHSAQVRMDPHRICQLHGRCLLQIRVRFVRPHHALQGGGFSRVGMANQFKETRTFFKASG